jgi:hypothetical protein
MLGTESPAAMMFNLSSGGLDGGVAMGFSMSGLSGLGLGKTSTSGRPDDEERRRRLMEIIRLLGTCYPRISPEGIESLGKRYGMDVQMEPPNRVGIAEVAVAGFNGSFMVTVGFQYAAGKLHGKSLNKAKVTYDELKHIQSATITFADKNAEARRQHDTSANRAIMRTLTLDPGQYYITSRLDKFAKNLERLGRMDKIYGTGFNALEAVAGVYNALEKLYEHEKKMAMTVFNVAKGDIEERAEKEVLCKKSGRPVMNPRKTVGLCLDYWLKRRKLLNRQREIHKMPPSEAVKAGTMEIDSQDDADNRIADHFYTLVIECEENPSPEMYPPARVSSAWISEQIEKQSEDPTEIFGPSIDWLDPPPTYLTEQNGTTSDSGIPLDSTHMGRLPNVRFVAKLDPPLVLPQAVATNILASVGANLAEPDNPKTYIGLLLDLDAEEDIAAWFTGQAKKHQRLVTVPEVDGTFTEHCHKNTLFVSKPELGRLLEEIPFTHPKQLVQLLPILRQYVLLNQVLADTFKDSKSASSEQVNASDSQTPIRMVDINLIPAITPQFSITSTVPRMNIVPHNDAANEHTSPSITLEDLLQQVNGGEDGDIEMPDRNAPGDNISAIVEILPNADINILDHSLIQPGEALAMLDSGSDGNPNATQAQEEQRRKVAERLGRALDISNDLGIWTEWMAKEAMRLAISG